MVVRRFLLLASLSSALGRPPRMQMSAEMSLELKTQATLAMMAEEVPVTTDQELHDKMSCPMSKVGCPLCYNIVENWNLEKKLPAHAEVYCADVVTDQWKAMYQTLTGKPFINMREKTRCVAIAAGVHEMVSQGCTLGSCSPELACSTFC